MIDSTTGHFCLKCHFICTVCVCMYVSIILQCISLVQLLCEELCSLGCTVFSDMRPSHVMCLLVYLCVYALFLEGNISSSMME